MESTWASGAIELLRHADSHIDLNTAFDKRIAFISIDNCVETVVRTFLSMPSGKSGVKVSRKEFEEAGNSFPKLLNLLYKHAFDKLVGIDEADIEHYHRIRNKLYHDGTGLSVDDQYLMAFRGIAGVLLQNLFDVALKEPMSEEATLEGLIVKWNTIERLIKQRLEDAGISGTYKWEEAFADGFVDPADVKTFTELRMARNRLVHSETIDKSDLSYWTKRSDQLLQKLQRLETQQEVAAPAHVEVGFDRLEVAQHRHRYSLVVSVTLKDTPDQDFFHINILWPRAVPIDKIKGFEEGEETEVEGHGYRVLSLFVDKRLWPGQKMKVVGGNTVATIEYVFDDKVHHRINRSQVDLHYTLFLQSWQPVTGQVPFAILNIY